MPISSVGRTSRRAAGSEPRPSGSGAAGITLIEMMVVVTILGLMIAITGPSISSGIDSIRMTSATNSVSSFLNAAVNRAERKQQPVELIISIKTSTISMFTNEPGSERELKLPDGIAIEAIEPASEEPDYRLVLMPGTAAPGIGIRLATSRGLRRRVRLDPMTGFPRVEAVEQQ